MTTGCDVFGNKGMARDVLRLLDRNSLTVAWRDEWRDAQTALDDNDGQNTPKRSNRQLLRHTKAKTEPDRTKIVKITERIDIVCPWTVN